MCVIAGLRTAGGQGQHRDNDRTWRNPSGLTKQRFLYGAWRLRWEAWTECKGCHFYPLRRRETSAYLSGWDRGVMGFGLCLCVVLIAPHCPSVLRACHSDCNCFTPTHPFCPARQATTYHLAPVCQTLLHVSISRYEDSEKTDKGTKER